MRGQRTIAFPTRFQLVASTNPCPCGHAGHSRCRCTEADVARHRRKLSGPLLDRMDLLVHMPRPESEALEQDVGTTSAEALAAVLEARERQAHRLAGTDCRTNAELTPRMLSTLVRADADARSVLRDAYAQGKLSARGHGRILRVARTIADLDGSARVRAGDVRVALSLRHEEVLDSAVAA